MIWYIIPQSTTQRLKKKMTVKFSGKGMDLEKFILSEVTQYLKDKHDMCSLTGADQKYRLTNLKSTAPENLDNNEGPKRNMQISLGRGSIKYLLGKLGPGIGGMKGWELDGMGWIAWGQEAGWWQDGRGE